MSKSFRSRSFYSSTNLHFHFESSCTCFAYAHSVVCDVCYACDREGKKTNFEKLLVLDVCVKCMSGVEGKKKKHVVIAYKEQRIKLFSVFFVDIFFTNCER